MRGELVWTTTTDRTRLNGFLAESSAARQTSIDAAIILHGLAGNFYSSGLLTFVARQLSGLGISVVLGNMRGHDFLNLTTQSGHSQLLGAAVENVADCRFDIPGWIQYLNGEGHSRILLVGHSLGAIKALYSQAYAHSSKVVGIVALSATRLNFEHFSNCSAKKQFLHSHQLAEQMIAANRENELFKFEFPFPTWMGAKSFVDKYGKDNRFDWVGFIDQIREPILLTFGQRELEEHPAFEGIESVARDTADKLPNVTNAKILNADHFYVACFDELWEEIEPWLMEIR